MKVNHLAGVLAGNMLYGRADCLLKTTMIPFFIIFFLNFVINQIVVTKGRPIQKVKLPFWALSK